MMTEHDFDEGSVYKSFTDVFLAIIVVLILAITVNKSKNLDSQAEYLASIQWDAKIDADVDFYVKVVGEDAASSSYIWFRNKSSHGVYLDRDSRGFVSDTILVNGKIEYLPHREVVSIRGEVVRDVIFGVQLYAYHHSDLDKERDLKNLDINVHFELIKINPTSKTVYTTDKKLDKVGDADNFLHIELGPNDFKIKDLPINPISETFGIQN